MKLSTKVLKICKMKCNDCVIKEECKKMHYLQKELNSLKENINEKIKEE